MSPREYKELQALCAGKLADNGAGLKPPGLLYRWVREALKEAEVNDD